MKAKKITCTDVHVEIEISDEEIEKILTDRVRKKYPSGSISLIWNEGQVFKGASIRVSWTGEVQAEDISL